MNRIYLSPPHMSVTERSLLLDTFDSNWIAPVGPNLDAFERQFSERHDAAFGVAVSSGTAGLHLALLVAGVKPGHEVITSSFTFAATANAIVYCGATPVFVDCDPHTWNLDPARVAEAIADAETRGVTIGAIVTVDLFGQCADHEPINALAAHHGIAVVEDAAEAVGATYRSKPAGTLGDIGVFSFNGNKIMTAGGGGMIVTNDADAAQRCRYLATQAREPVRHYEHRDVGFNYRMSNVLAAIGLGQLARLDELMASRQRNRTHYVSALGDCDGVDFQPIDPNGSPNYWLTVMTLGLEARAERDEVIDALEQADIEARPAWKPMHMQPVFAEHTMFGGSVSEEIFTRAICLPSGSQLTETDRERVIEVVRGVLT